MRECSGLETLASLGSQCIRWSVATGAACMASLAPAEAARVRLVLEPRKAANRDRAARHAPGGHALDPDGLASRR